MGNTRNAPMESAAAVEVSSQHTKSLLDTIRRIHARVGDGLGDEELTFFLLRQNLPAEEGFGFLCFHDGCVTLSVPSQDETSWHPPIGWISPAKERIGMKIAQKYGLVLSEPLDAPCVVASPGACDANHHFVLSNRQESLIIAHPEFLKIRLYATVTKLALPVPPKLLADLSALYEQC